MWSDTSGCSAASAFFVLDYAISDLILYTTPSFSEGRTEMYPMSLSLVGAVILILDIFALVSVLLGNSGAVRKLIWIALILLLPIVGMVLYFLIGRSPADARI